MIKLILAFLKIGFLGFGGGYAMLSLIFQESKTFGLTAMQFADLTALDGIIPGPIAINSATYVGQLYAGLPGAIVATLVVCVPSLLFIPLYMHFEEKIKNNQLFSGILRGIKPASVGLILAIGLTLLLSTVLGMPDILHWASFHVDYVNLFVLGLVLFLDYKYHVNPVILILLAGVIGGVAFYL